MCTSRSCHTLLMTWENADRGRYNDYDYGGCSGACDGGCYANICI